MLHITARSDIAFLQRENNENCWGYGAHTQSKVVRNNVCACAFHVSETCLSLRSVPLLPLQEFVVLGRIPIRKHSARAPCSKSLIVQTPRKAAAVTGTNLVSASIRLIGCYYYVSSQRQAIQSRVIAMEQYCTPKPVDRLASAQVIAQ